LLTLPAMMLSIFRAHAYARPIRGPTRAMLWF
jgi:hypothetical protein